jgi:hypothetical protein
MTKTTKCFRMGITIDKWGPSAWNTLHSFAHRAPDSLSKDDQNEWKMFLYLFAKRLPCPKCRMHLKEYFDEHISSSTFTRKEHIVRFLHDAHNNVNKRLGKAVWTYEEHCLLYSRSYENKNDIVSTEMFISLIVIYVLIFIYNRRLAKKYSLKDKYTNAF